MRSLLFGFLLGIICSVASYDVYVSMKYEGVLHQTEENPIGRWLIQLDHGRVGLFMTVKLMGTVLVLLMLPLLYQIKPLWGWITTTSVAAFQVSLFCYLSFA